MSINYPLLAEGKGTNGFLNAAEKYERMASEAEAKGDFEAANILTRMANIKRQAANGSLKNWDQYHKLNKMLKSNNINKNKKASYEKEIKNRKKGIPSYKDRNKTSNSFNKNKEDRKKSSFGSQPKKEGVSSKKLSPEAARQTSKKLSEQSARHEKQADQALLSGDFKTANIQARLARLLASAAESAQRGSHPQLTEYFALLRELYDFSTSSDLGSNQKDGE